MRKIDWKPFAHKYLKDRRVILHSDSARSNRMKVPGMLHDAVVHQKSRVKRAGKWVWKKPTFVNVSVHKLPDGRTMPGPRSSIGPGISSRSACGETLFSQRKFAVHRGSIATATRTCGHAPAHSSDGKCASVILQQSHISITAVFQFKCLFGAP